MNKSIHGARDSEQSVIESLWQNLEGSKDLLSLISLGGQSYGLHSRFAVADFATGAIAVADLAVAELVAKLKGQDCSKVKIDRHLASAAFRCERLLTAEGWTLPAPWDPIAGDYLAEDGWIRLHTNYSYHREAVTRLLGIEAKRELVAEKVAGWRRHELETAVVDAGGCAAALRTLSDWQSHPQAKALAKEKLIAFEGKQSSIRAIPRVKGRPLSGLRVLDLTRVIAGPTASRFLAAFGADVLRIDPPDFEEVPALLPEMTQGKRCAFLDLKSNEGRKHFAKLLKEADVLLYGLRGGSLAAMGFDEDRLAKINPQLVVAELSAYGWSGPWQDRRGFDSLVQMNTGIAHPQSEGKPTPLPAQALDHGTGYLAAAAICRALVDGRKKVRLSLARTAAFLVEQGEVAVLPPEGEEDLSSILQTSRTHWGTMRQVRPPVGIDGVEAEWLLEGGPLGRSQGAWLARK